MRPLRCAQNVARSVTVPSIVEEMIVQETTAAAATYQNQNNSLNW